MREVLNIIQYLECFAYAKNHTKMWGEMRGKKKIMKYNWETNVLWGCQPKHTGVIKGILEKEKRQM